MSATATNLSRILVTGSSLSQVPPATTGNWAGRQGGLFDQLHAKTLASIAAAPASSLVNYVPSRVGQTPPASYVAAPTTGRRQVCMTYGVPGRTLGALVTDLQASVFCWGPDIVIVEMGANDFGVTGVGGLGSAWAIAVAGTIDGIHAGLPNAQIIFCSMTPKNETVAGGHFADGTDTWAGNSDTQLVIANAGRSAYTTYCDYITPMAAFAVSQSIAASPKFLTQDSLHPSDLGCVIMGTTVLNTALSVS